MNENMKLNRAIIVVFAVGLTSTTAYDAPTKREIVSLKFAMQAYFRTDSVTFNYVPTAVRLGKL